MSRIAPMKGSLKAKDSEKPEDGLNKENKLQIVEFFIRNAAINMEGLSLNIDKTTVADQSEFRVKFFDIRLHEIVVLYPTSESGLAW